MKIVSIHIGVLIYKVAVKRNVKRSSSISISHRVGSSKSAMAWSRWGSGLWSCFAVSGCCGPRALYIAGVVELLLGCLNSPPAFLALM
ncbi:unnamed protein product [Urochloa humidicola]